MECILSFFYKAPSAIVPAVALSQIATAIYEFKHDNGGADIASCIFTLISGLIHGYMGGLLLGVLYDVIIAKGDSWLEALAYVFVCLYITMRIRQSVWQHGINHYTGL
jgi:hypothetical protein